MKDEWTFAVDIMRCQCHLFFPLVVKIPGAKNESWNVWRTESDWLFEPDLAN